MCYGIQSDEEGEKMSFKNEKATTLKHDSIFSTSEKTSEMFRPDKKNASAEALICLECPLPECKKNVCQRYKEEAKKIKKTRRRKK